MRAIVVAAGRALKDAPIADGIPKCLLKVGKMGHPLQTFKACGIKDGYRYRLLKGADKGILQRKKVNS